MKVGKVPENVLKRSVLKHIEQGRKEVLTNPGVGQDCAAVLLEEEEVMVMSTDPITGTSTDIGSLAVHVTVNDLASAGAEPIGIMLTILLPVESEEAELKEIMKQARANCQRFGLQIIGGHTEITDAVNRPVLSVTGIGKVKKGKMVTASGVKVGQDIIVSKWIGIEGTSIVAKEKETELLAKLPKTIVDTAKAFDQYISVLEDSKIAVKAGVTAMHDITEGGIFGALWEIAEASKIGLDIDLKKIPVRQETIEICEFFDLNPYCLISSGSMLMAADNGNDIVMALEKAGIPASVIGKATDGNDRIIRNDEEIRYLELPKTDELYKIS